MTRNTVRALVLLTAFLAEAAALAAVAHWAWWIAAPMARWFLVPAVVVAFSVMWGRWLAPRSAHLLPGRWSRVGKSVVFAVSAAAAIPVWGLVPAIVLGAVGIATAAFAQHAT